LGLSSWERGVDPRLAQGILNLLAAAAGSGIQARVTSARRTHAQQVALYRRYLAGMNPYPVAPPGTSEHEIGQAVDVWAGSEENNALLGRTWVRWGGRWSTRDSVHFTL
jgi:LAS superfamily LD-carboxypeptidase LdcB